MRTCIVILLLCFNASAAVWYADPNATAGDGSLNNPWALAVALTNTASIVPGDTLYLRVGTYVGGFTSTLGNSTNNHILVSAYPFERVIITDNPTGATLGTTMTSGTGTIVINGSEHYHSSSVISIDNENMQISGQSGTTWNVNRGWNGTTATSHSIGTVVTPYGVDIIAHSGTNVWFKDLFFTSQYTTNRHASAAFFPGSGLDLHGVANKAINCWFYNTGHPAIGFWDQGAGGEVNGCVIWGTGQYDFTASFNGDIRGQGTYSQNSTNGTATIRNCIYFANLTGGPLFFGETGPVKDAVIDGNICVGNGLGCMGIQSGSTSTSNTWMINNLVTATPDLSYVSVSNNLEIFTNNIIVNGSFSEHEYTNSTYTYNTAFFPNNSTGDGTSPVQAQSTTATRAQLHLTWDHNTYYAKGTSSLYQWGFSTTDISAKNGLGSDVLKFNNDGTNGWTNWTGYDVNSTTNVWPSTYTNVTVQTLDYDSLQKHICVICTSGATNYSLDLSTNGFVSGDVFELRDGQNPLQVVTMGIYTSGSINLPLNLTNFASISGNVTNFTPQHYNVAYPGLFNVFLLRRYPGRARMHY